MSFAFDKPIGAVADVKELEYIAALHQTSDDDDEDFLNASIEARDVKHFLMSRYSVEVDKEQVRQVIFNGLGGGDGTDECIDIVELVSILIIPSLLKASGKQDREVKEAKDFDSKKSYEKYLEVQKEIHELSPSPTLISDVLKIILIDTTDSDEYPKLSRSLLEKVFAWYGEMSLITDDDLIDEMIELASGGNPDALFDVESFSRALTNDVLKYPVQNESKISTHYDDVFGNNDSGDEDIGKISFTEEDGVTKKGIDVKRIFTFPHIDFLAERLGSVSHTFLVWLCFVYSYLTYVSTASVFSCSSDSFGCKIASSIISWIMTGLTLVIFGMIFISILSLGNSNEGFHIFEILLGMVGIGLFLFTPLFVDADIFFAKIGVDSSDKFTYAWSWFAFSIAVLLSVLQVRNLLLAILPKNKVPSRGILAKLFIPSNIKKESQLKSAATLKVNKMLANAYDLHCEDEDTKSFQVRKSRISSTNERSLLNFTKISDKTESQGGFIWGWKTFFSGDIMHKEGIWIHSRIRAGNGIQFIFAIFALSIGIYVFTNLIDSLYPDPSPMSEDCFALFDPDSCFYPKADDLYTGVGICQVQLTSVDCLDLFQQVPTGSPIAASFCLSADNHFSNTFNTTYSGLCNGGIYKATEIVNALANNSTAEDYCISPMDLCVSLGGIEGICLIGINGVTPFQFEGTTCPQYVDINGIQETYRETLYLVEQQQEELMPEKWMVYFTASISVSVCFVVAMANALVYIPSIISTILQFRSGVIPSLRSKTFKIFRKDLHDVTFVLGAMIWGVLISSALVAIIIAGVVFLLVWQATRSIVTRIFSLVIGVAVTVALKMLLVKIFGKFTYTGFYRKRPLTANLFSLALECWHLGITSLSVVIRLVKLIVSVGIYVGRIDTIVLAEGLLLNLDNFPIIFRKDLLAAEAHRHPYLERLGMMVRLIRLDFLQSDT